MKPILPIFHMREVKKLEHQWMIVAPYVSVFVWGVPYLKMTGTK